MDRTAAEKGGLSVWGRHGTDCKPKPKPAKSNLKFEQVIPLPLPIVDANKAWFHQYTLEFVAALHQMQRQIPMPFLWQQKTGFSIPLPLSSTYEIYVNSTANLLLKSRFSMFLIVVASIRCCISAFQFQALYYLIPVVSFAANAICHMSVVYSISWIACSG